MNTPKTSVIYECSRTLCCIAETSKKFSHLRIIELESSIYDLSNITYEVTDVVKLFYSFFCPKSKTLYLVPKPSTV